MKMSHVRNRKLTTSIILCLSFGLIFGLILISYSRYSDWQTSELLKKSDISRQKSKEAAAAAREAKKKEIVYITLPGATKIPAIVEDYYSTDSVWQLVNKTHSLSTDFKPNNLVIPNVATRTDKSNDERSIRSDIADAMKSMFDAADASGLKLLIGSGFRSAAQQSIYFNSLAASVGETAANQSIARPGQSEHQTGLVADIAPTSMNCYLDTCFADTNEGKWLAKNSYKYGFILRYPSDKTEITGYRYEPWHFRYVGIDLATALYQSKLTLEEAWPYLEESLTTLKSNGAL